MSKIGSALGKSQVTDECTTDILRVSYARILVEVDITQELAKEINMKDNQDKKLKQPVQSEWKPLFCEKCQRGGHQCVITPKKNNVK